MIAVMTRQAGKCGYRIRMAGTAGRAAMINSALFAKGWMRAIKDRRAPCRGIVAGSTVGSKKSGMENRILMAGAACRT